MTRSLLPPRGLFVGTRWLFDPALSAPVKETLLQIMALTWINQTGHTTPVLSYPQLEQLTGKPARTLRGHLLALRTYHAALRLQRAGAGQFIIALADWLFKNTVPFSTDADSGEMLPAPANDQEEEEIYPDGMDSLLPDLNDHDQGGGEKTAQPNSVRSDTPRRGGTAAEPLPAPRKLSKALEKRMRDAGVFPALLPEMAERAARWQYSVAELNRLLDWCADEQPDRAAGLFVARVRAGARAPARYANPACPRCGKRGRHDSDCAMRYTEGF